MKTSNNEIIFEKFKNKSHTCQSGSKQKRLTQNFLYQNTIGFQCSHCRIQVLCDHNLSGVQNRNHCPYCLWSRHVDLYQPGDRLAACKAPMQPIGLSFKQAQKKYACASGELMLIHLCSDCGGLSINRIAADDDAEKLYQVYQASARLNGDILTRLQSSQINLLGSRQNDLVMTGLFGRR